MTHLTIDEARATKYFRGKEKHRGSGSGPFVGNPLEELDDELIDAMNYVHQAQTEGRISHRTGKAWARQLRQLCEHLRFVMGVKI